MRYLNLKGKERINMKELLDKLTAEQLLLVLLYAIELKEKAKEKAS